MKGFLSKCANSKIGCGLFMALSLVLLILLVMEKSDTPGVSDEPPGTPNASEKVKAKYRERVGFSRDTWVEFPDFNLLYLGTGVSTSGGMHVPIKTYYFRIVRGSEETIVFWTAGTGVIGPIPFEFDGDDYVIEMKRMADGRGGEAELGDNELSISRAD